MRDSWSRRKEGKGRGQPLPAGLPRKMANNVGIKNRLVRVGKVVHPCRVKSFRKAVSMVMDELGDQILRS